MNRDQRSTYPFVLIGGASPGMGDVRVWIGHYVNRPTDWFLVWAHTKEEAIGFLTQLRDAPDLASFTRVPGPGVLELEGEPTTTGRLHFDAGLA